MLLRSAALGAASGARSSTGVAAVVVTSSPYDPGLAGRLGGHVGTTIAVLTAAAELVLDQLPGVPSRLAPAGLVPRLAFGAASAYLAASRARQPVVVPALVAVAAAGGAAVLGVRWRAFATDRFGSDRPGALIEDAVAAGLARWGARRG